MDVLVVEGQEVVRRGLLDMLGHVPRVGRAEGCADGDAIPALLKRFPLAPDIVIVGTALGAWMDQARVTRLCGPVRLLALVSNAEPGHLTVAAMLRADGYVMLAGLTIDGLASAIDQMANGGMPLPPEMAQHLLGHAGAFTASPAILHASLTPRERDVLHLVVEGLSNKQIAMRLGVSLYGAKRYVSSILSKFHCDSRAQLISLTLRNRMLDANGAEGLEYEPTLAGAARPPYP